MFQSLTNALQSAFSKLSGRAKLTEENLKEAISQVRLALLDADVNFKVVKRLIKSVKEKAVGMSLVKTATPAQQFVNIVHEELVALMGGDEINFEEKSNPSTWLVCGLQGSGKTTHCVKLAHYFKKQKIAKKPLIVACDLQRPAAIMQLEQLAATNNIAVYKELEIQDPVKVATLGKTFALENNHDLIIFDTAGRLHIDTDLLSELQELHKVVDPDEVVFVANAALGQESVKIANSFNETIPITGSILTMLDGNARAGAALSIVEVTGKPLYFEGTGEKIEDIQLFNPDSMAQRVLGMGDALNLFRKAQDHVNEEDAKELEKKIRKASLTFEDYLKQMQAMKKMGPLKKLMEMMPGMSKLTQNVDFDESQIHKVEAIILSMTPRERSCLDDLSVSRKKRLAAGSGTKIEDVNRLLKSFKQIKIMLRKKLPNMNQLEKMMGGSQSWL